MRALGLRRRIASVFKDYKHFYSRHAELHTQPVEIVFPDSVQRYEHLQCNSDRILYTNMPEVLHLEHHLSGLRPKQVLEIGCGLGRGAVNFAKRFSWYDTVFHMLDGDTGQVKHAGVDRKGPQEFYNSLEATKTFCTANGIRPENVRCHDASTDAWIRELEGTKLDVICSFLAIGFHWSIDSYLPKLQSVCHSETLLIFGMRGTDRGNEFAMRQVAELDRSVWRIVANRRDSELVRSSVLVLKPAA